MPSRPGRRELLALLAILALAALLRLPGLDERGRWDADQGHDMLVLRALVTQGEVPLLGPRTSIGTFHHGAVYYYLLAPAALASGADPVAVTGEIALIGIAAVAAVWWLARLLGGPLAGMAAGLLAAISPAGIDESTFIWNPNLIPLAAALAFGGAIRAWQTGRAGWWVLSAAGAMVTMQCHILGVVVLPPLLIAFLADARRRRADGASMRPLVRAGVVSTLVIAAGYLPLLVHELGHDFSEIRAILGYVAGGSTAGGVPGSPGAPGLAGRVAMVGLRSIAWPLAGLLTDRPAASLAAVLAAAVLMGAAAFSGRVRAGSNRPWAAWWLLATLAWSAVALALFAPGLAVVTPGLPNDHYHAFLDPIVLALCGAGIARLAAARLPWRHGDRRDGPATQPPNAGVPRPRAAAAPALAALAMALVLVGAGIGGWPPPIADDGGWRLADEAAARAIAELAGERDVALVGIPPFKSADALRFPLERRGLDPLPAATGDGTSGEAGPGSGGETAAHAAMTLVVCDPLFDDVVGAPCGGGAEEAWAVASGAEVRLRDRFAAGSRRIISVYDGPGG